jgi:hypothetical protein
VLNSSAQLAGDGLRTSVGGKLGLVRVERLGRVLLWRVIDANVDIRVGVLDSGEGSHDTTVSIFDLATSLAWGFRSDFVSID